MNSPFWIPVWGNVLDQHIQSPPLPLLTTTPSSDQIVICPKDDSQSAHPCQSGNCASVNTKASLSIKKEASDYNIKERPSGPNTYYEELIGLGLDYSFDRLVATIRVKQSVGYQSDLCGGGGWEFISFWADWNNTCNWTYLGTQQINVHNINDIPPDGLIYSVVLPVDLQYERALCNTTKVARVRAALAFGSPPPTPPELPARGYFLVKHVQLQPFESASTVAIQTIGGVGIGSILWTTTGMTTNGSRFFNLPFALTDPLSLGRASPFGGTIIVTGLPVGLPNQYSYRLLAPNTPGGSPVPVLNDIQVYNSITNVLSTLSPDMNGYLPYIVTNPNYNVGNILSSWTPQTSGLYQIQLEVATTGSEVPVAYSPLYNVYVNNIYPTGDIFPTSGSTCGDFVVGVDMVGEFFVNAKYLAYWQFDIPTGFTIIPPGIRTGDTVNVPLSVWTMTTAKVPCGYTVGLYIQDLTIWNSLPYSPMSIDRGFSFCLVA